MSEKWKHVSVGQCIGIIIGSLILACVAFVPLTCIADGSGTITGVNFFFKGLPLVGTEEFQKVTATIAGNSVTFINGIAKGALPEIVGIILNYAFTYNVYAYFGILALNVVCGLLLLLTRANGLRKFFKFFSVIFGIVMILVNITFLAEAVLNIIIQVGNETQFIYLLLMSGVLPYIVLTLFSFILIFKQFGWFSDPYANAEIQSIIRRETKGGYFER